MWGMAPPHPGREEGQLGLPLRLDPGLAGRGPASPREAKVISKGRQPARLPLDPDAVPTVTRPPAIPKPPQPLRGFLVTGAGQRPDSLRLLAFSEPLCPGRVRGRVSILPEGPPPFSWGQLPTLGASSHATPLTAHCAPSCQRGLSLSLFLCPPQPAASSVTGSKPPELGGGAPAPVLAPSSRPQGPGGGSQLPLPELSRLLRGPCLAASAPA